MWTEIEIEIEIVFFIIPVYFTFTFRAFMKDNHHPHPWLTMNAEFCFGGALM